MRGNYHTKNACFEHWNFITFLYLNVRMLEDRLKAKKDISMLKCFSSYILSYAEGNRMRIIDY
jgi:hypothetical protein